MSSSQRVEAISRQLTYTDLEKKPIKVTVTGAAGNIGYSIIFMMAQGRMFGATQPIELTLLELPTHDKILQGLLMELDDCALPLLRRVRGTTDLKEGFTDCDAAILVGAKPRGPGMERKDLLAANSKIFEIQGKAINTYANKGCKVCVVGNPANTNAMICMLNAPNIPKENFTALTRLDQNRAVAQLAIRLRTNTENVRNVIIWGNHSATQYPDVNHAFIIQDGVHKDIKSSVNNDVWLRGEFISVVQKRGAAIIAARKLSSAASAANAVCDHMHDWINGTNPGEYVSMAVRSDGSYGVPKDLIYSFPVTCSNGSYKIVQSLTLDEFSKKKLELTTKELEEERDMALKK